MGIEPRAFAHAGRCAAPLGQRAGVGAALMSTISNLIATPIGAWLGYRLNGSVDALVWGVALCALGALWVTARVRRTPAGPKVQA